MSETMIHISLHCDVTLRPGQIWPDGDAPEEITREAVLDVIDETCFGGEWNLPYSFDVRVTRPTTAPAKEGE